jgi:hypothetical protein
MSGRIRQRKQDSSEDEDDLPFAPRTKMIDDDDDDGDGDDDDDDDEAELDEDDPPVTTIKLNGLGSGERYSIMCEFFDKHRKILLPKLLIWFDFVIQQFGGVEKTTAAGNRHWVITTSHDALNFVFPKTTNFSRKSQAGSLFHLLAELGWPQKTIQLSWLSCYLAGHRIDKSKKGWKKFNCSHRCCEYEESLGDDGRPKRLEGFRCIDARCLVFESHSDNLSRANAMCRLPHPHDDQGRTVCVANGCHGKYPCL